MAQKWEEKLHSAGNTIKCETGRVELIENYSPAHTETQHLILRDALSVADAFLALCSLCPMSGTCFALSTGDARGTGRTSVSLQAACVPEREERP